MTPKRIFWVLCIAGIVFFLFYWNSQKDIPQQKVEKTEDVKTSGRSHLSDILIGKTAKLVILQAINHVDMEKTKRAAIEKIKKKRDEGYIREINRIFDDIEYMGVKDTFGLTRNSSREEVIKAIEDLDKDTLLKKLDEIPEQAIADLIMKKLREQELHSLAQIKDFLNEKIYRLIKI